MRLLAWSGLGLLVLLVAVLAAVDWIATGMVNRDPLRSQIDQIVDDALGRDADWSALGVSLFPPSLVIDQANIAGATDEAESFVEAEVKPPDAGADAKNLVLIHMISP